MKENNEKKGLRMNIRLKILLGVSVVLAILLALGITAIFNLTQIRGEFDGLVEATQVERYALNARVHVRDFRLGDYEAADKVHNDLKTIITALETIDKASTNTDLLEKSKAARTATLEYTKAFDGFLEAMKSNKVAVATMVNQGQQVIKLAKEYYENSQKEAALWVYINALEIMKSEKDERLYKNRDYYKDMLQKRGELIRYFNQMDGSGTDEKVNQPRRVRAIVRAQAPPRTQPSKAPVPADPAPFPRRHQRACPPNRRPCQPARDRPPGPGLP